MAASPIGSGNTVAVPARATPCKASFHQSYSGICSRGIARDGFTSCDAFSSSVIRETRSSTRTLGLGRIEVQRGPGRLCGLGRHAA